MANAGRSSTRLYSLALLVVLATIAFAPVFGTFFDPQDFISFLNPLRSGVSLDRYLIDSWSWMQDGRRIGFIRPVTSMAFLADYHLWGGEPAGYRAVNVALHIACCACVALLAGRLGAGRMGALAAGALFAVHPGAQNAVTLIVARHDLLATLFLLLAVLATLRLMDGSGPLQVRRLLPVFAFTALALGSKELGMAGLAAVPLLVLLGPVGRRSGSFIPVVIGTAVIAAAYLGLRLAVFRGIGGYTALTPIGQMPANLLTMTLQASGSWFVGSALIRRAWLLLAGLMLLRYAALDPGRWKRLAVMALLLVLLGFQAVVGFPCAHYVYAPAAIFCALLGLGASEPDPVRRRWPAVASVAALFIALPFGIILSWNEGRAYRELNRPMEEVFGAVGEAAQSFEAGAAYTVLIPSGGSPEQLEMKNVRLYLAWFRPGEGFEFAFSGDSAGVPDGCLIVWDDGRVSIR